MFALQPYSLVTRQHGDLDTRWLTTTFSTCIDSWLLSQVTRTDILTTLTRRNALRLFGVFSIGSDKVVVSKQKWAYPVWYIIHIASLHESSVREPALFWSFMDTIPHIIPCVICAEHARIASPHLPATESIPRRHLCHHCCPPGHLPLCNTCVTQQRSTMCCNHMHCVATECHLRTIPPRTAHAATGCCAAGPLAASDPIRASEATAPLAAKSRGACAALWTTSDGLRRKRGRAFDCPEYSRRRESTCHWQTRLG